MDIASQLNRSVSSINSDYFKIISNWSSDIRRLAKGKFLNLDDFIPSNFYEPLEQLIDLIEPSLSHADNSEIFAEITVKEKEAVCSQKLSWFEYLQILFMVITFAYGLYDSHTSSLQFQ